MSQTNRRQLDKAFARARSALSAGDYASAEALLKQVISQDSGYAAAYHYLGRLAQVTGHHAHAVPLFQEAVRLEPGNIEYIKRLAAQLKTCGDHAGSLAAVKQGIARNPGSSDLKGLLSRLEKGAPALDLSAKVAELGRLAGREEYGQMLPLAREVLLEDEKNLQARHFYGMALLHTGAYDDSIRQFEAVLRSQPEHDEAWGQLGVAFMHKHLSGPCIAAHERALMIKPTEPTHHINAAVAYLEFNQTEQAAAHANEALRLKGDSIAALALLGRIAGKCWEYDKARALLNKALELKPGYKSAMATLVDVLLAEGKLKETEWECRRLLAMDSGMMAVYNTLVDTLTGQQKYPEAVKYAEIGANKQPEFIPLQNRLAICYSNIKRYADCIAKYREILERLPEYFPSRLNLAGTYSLVGEHELCMENYAIALQSKEVEPDHVSNWIFAHLYNPEMSAQHILDISRRWASDYHGSVTPYTSWEVDTARDAPLRIGIISGDFRDHPVGFFLESVLRNLSNQGVEVYLYSTVLTEDSTSKRFIEFADQWCKAFAMSPQALAEKIREDRVQVLIDVAGHTAHNRLSVFARKPSPVQITWLGYLSTTGIDAMDYIIGDPWVTPPGEEDHFVEEPLVLPNTYQCLSEPRNSPDVADLPALENGFITFGSFNNFAKLNEPVLDLWAEVLKAVDGSRLLLKNQVLTDPVYQKVLRRKFKARGIDADRLMFEASRSREHILESYGRVDIGLDPFPYTGCTTTFESLWMGVPVITRVGNRFLSHAGESIMNNLGMPDWVAGSGEDYVRLAVEKAADVEALAQVRSGLRERIKASPLMDAETFAAQFHDALKQAWSRWQEQHTEKAIA